MESLAEVDRSNGTTYAGIDQGPSKILPLQMRRLPVFQRGFVKNKGSPDENVDEVIRQGQMNVGAKERLPRVEISAESLLWEALPVCLQVLSHLFKSLQPS